MKQNVNIHETKRSLNKNKFDAANSNFIMRRSPEDIWGSMEEKESNSAYAGDYRLMSNLYGLTTLLLSSAVIVYLCSKIFTL